MPIIDDVSSQMKEAMKARDKVRLGALRGIRAALIEAMKAAVQPSLSPNNAAFTGFLMMTTSVER